MPRVPFLSKEDLPADKQDLYDQIGSQRGHVAPPFAALLNSPEVAARVAAVGEQLRYVSESISPQMRELVTLTTAQQIRCQYVWTHHVFSAKEAGLTEETIAVIRDDAPLAGMELSDAAFIRFTRELLGDKTISDTTYAAVEAILGPQVTTDVLLMIGYYSMLCYAINGLKVELEEGVAPNLPVGAEA